jgi:putative ABC transport system permease protein
MIMAQAKSEKYMNSAEDAMNDLIRQRHNIRENAESDFSIRNLTAMAKTASEYRKDDVYVIRCDCMPFHFW